MKTARYLAQLGLLGLISMAAIASAPGAETSLSTILKKNHEATRGGSEIGSIRTMDLTLNISEADYTLAARYRAAADGRMRIDVFAGDERVFSEGKDELGVWEWPGGQEAPQNVQHEGVGALEHGIEFNLFSLSELSERGHSIELVGEEKHDEATYFVLKITLRDGFETYRLVNTETWLVDISRDYRAFHPGVNADKEHLETRYDQWQTTSGILHASRSRTFNITTDAIVATAKVMQTNYNIAQSQLNLERSFLPDGPPKPHLQSLF